jgi:hypothetical protein
MSDVELVLEHGEEEMTGPEFPKTVEVTVEYLTALRKEVGRHIDPDTAEAIRHHANIFDPYYDFPNLPEEYHSVDKECFARAPGSEIWIHFSDLPEGIAQKIYDRYTSQTTKLPWDEEEVSDAEIEEFVALATA